MPSASDSHRGELLSPNRTTPSHSIRALEHDDVSICDECKQVDWSAVPNLAAEGFFGSREVVFPTYPTLRPLNETAEQLRSSACKICRILSNIRPAPDFEKCFLTAMPISRALYIGNYQNLSEGTVLTALPEPPEGVSTAWYESYYLPSGFDKVLGITKPGVAKYDFEAREIVTDSIDFSFLRDVVRFCSDEHRCCFRGTSSLDNVPRLKVIDVTTRTVIQAPDKCEYIALSYVWGTGAYGSSYRDDLEHPPQIIEDAMFVTSSLGYRYLWVDKYCIPQSIDTQEHREEKEQMINHMDHIYADASITIIGAAGNGAETGLPGVSYPRQAPKRVNFGDVNIFELPGVPFQRAHDDLLDSKWASRAWTYQEGYLSSRRLIFTENHVMFLCKEFCAPESVKRPLQVAATLDANDAWRFSRLVPEHGSQHRYQLEHPINEYSRRELTHQNDRLNAFLGILNHFMHESDPEEPMASLLHLFWGLTVRRGMKYHDGDPEGPGPEPWCADLLWHHPTPTTRRTGFPSWSWLGWHGPCELNFSSHVRLSSELFEIAGLGDGHRFQSLQLLADSILAEIRQGQRSSLKSGQAESKLRILSKVLPIRIERLPVALSEYQSKYLTEVSTRHSDGKITTGYWPREGFSPEGDVAILQICEGVYIGLNAYLDQQLPLDKKKNILGLMLGNTYAFDTTDVGCILVRHLSNDLFERVGCYLRPGGGVLMDATGRILDKVTIPPESSWVITQEMAMAEKRELYLI